MQTRNLRSAIAMIELIFAIVVMGIAMMSAPMLVSTASKSTTVVLEQESVNEVLSRVAMVMTYPWDEADTNDSCIPPVLHVSNGDSRYEPLSSDPSRRRGVPKATFDRKFNTCGEELNASTTLGSETNDMDDMDDFNNPNGGLVQIDPGSPDYIEKATVKIATSIYYTADDAQHIKTSSSPTTNIKAISVTLTSSSSADELKDKNIKMYGFKCNIGGIGYAKRTF